MMGSIPPRLRAPVIMLAGGAVIAAVAVFEFTGDWPSLTPGHTRLINLTTPADLSAGNR